MKRFTILTALLLLAAIACGQGNVGIGTATPTELLDVDGGDAMIHGHRIGRGGGALTTNLSLGYEALRDNVSGVYDTSIGFAQVDNTGKIGYTSSSKRYKENISDMTDIDWLYELRPVNFNYKSDELKKTQYGLIAEEVEQINPEFVSYNAEGTPETVSYSSLISPLLKSVQEQHEMITQLQQRIAELEEKLKVGN